MRKLVTVVLIGLMAAATLAVGAAAPTGKTPYAKWERGYPNDETFFPITVWLQDPSRAPRYKAIGFNTMVGLWKGPTEEQLATLKKLGMRVFCEQNAVGLKHLDDPTIVGWMHGDEPDNAQSLGKGKGYGPPVPPAKIIADYERIKKNDPSRPVMLNLGQGVAWDGWRGRGVRTNHPEDYAEYAKGGDIISFDIYPTNAKHKDVKDKLHLVPFGVDRLYKWTEGKKVIWNCIECTGFGRREGRPTPHEVKAEVWMSLVHGSKGLIYFVHEFQIKDASGKVTRKFNGAGLLADKEMSQAVGEINKQIHTLAPVLNSPTVAGGVAVASSNAKVPVDTMVKRYRGATYLFAVGMRDGETKATFTIPGATVEVLGENRTLKVTGGQFTDTFKPYDVHLYKISG